VDDLGLNGERERRRRLNPFELDAVAAVVEDDAIEGAGDG